MKAAKKPPGTRTVGIALSSQTANTGICTIDWSGKTAKVLSIVVNARDEDIVDAVEGVDAYGIDTPFGWPWRFVQMITRDMTGEAPLWTKRWRDQVRFRLTDHVIMTISDQLPISVASDRLAITAMRGQGLLRRLGVTKRWGDDKAVEVHTDVALTRWDLPTADYHRKIAGKQRKHLVAALEAAAPWLELSGSQRALCQANDDAIDSVLCALVARAATLDLIEQPQGSEQLDAARREGWAAIPKPGSLGRLPGRKRAARRAK